MTGNGVLLTVAVTLAISFRTGECAVGTCLESITTVSGSYSPSGKICSGGLIFKDNFDKLDLKIWEHENTLTGGGNWEFQWYTNNRSVSYVKEGNLHIKPSFVSDHYGNDFLYSGTLDVNGGTQYEACTNARDWGCSRTGTGTHLINSIKSARIRTINSFAFKYGKVEIRAKIPSGDWLWPAILLKPKYLQYGGWPASGEIDLMESRGNSELLNADGRNIGNQMAASTLHFGPGWGHNKWKEAHFEEPNTEGFSNDFHKYQLEWTDTSITFMIDDIEIGAVAPPDGGFWELGRLNHSGLENPWRNQGIMTPFDEEFYLVISLAVGGIDYFPDNARNGLGPKPWKNTSPTSYRDFWEGRRFWEPTWKMNTDDSHFQIDYIKVWAI